MAPSPRRPVAAPTTTAVAAGRWRTRRTWRCSWRSRRACDACWPSPRCSHACAPAHRRVPHRRRMPLRVCAVVVYRASFGLGVRLRVSSARPPLNHSLRVDPCVRRERTGRDQRRLPRGAPDPVHGGVTMHDQIDGPFAAVFTCKWCRERRKREESLLNSECASHNLDDFAAETFATSRGSHNKPQTWQP